MYGGYVAVCPEHGPQTEAVFEDFNAEWLCKECEAVLKTLGESEYDDFQGTVMDIKEAASKAQSYIDDISSLVDQLQDIDRDLADQWLNEFPDVEELSRVTFDVIW